MEVWPPPPTAQKPQTEINQVNNKKRLGQTALAFSIVAVVIRAIVFLKIHQGWLGELSFLFLGIGFVLGLWGRSTLAGRLALLGPLPFLGLLVYYLLSWYGI